jgi:dihydroorotase
MNIRNALLEDKIQNRNKAVSIAEYACSSPKHFKELMQCFLTNEYRLAQREAWSVSCAARKKPELIKPYIKDLVARLNRTGVHDAVVRNSVRVLEKIEIPESLHGEVMNACFGFIEKPSVPVAIKAFSLTTLFNLSKYYPEIKGELKLIIENNLDNESAAFESRGRKILSTLQKNSF